MYVCLFVCLCVRVCFVLLCLLVCLFLIVSYCVHVNATEWNGSEWNATQRNVCHTSVFLSWAYVLTFGINGFCSECDICIWAHLDANLHMDLVRFRLAKRN